MHYKDGTEAKVGDLIKGTGYNIKNADGTPAVLVGTLISATPGSDSCNMTILVATIEEVKDLSGPAIYKINEGHRIASTYLPDGTYAAHVIGVRTEYGQLDHFELIHRPE